MTNDLKACKEGRVTSSALRLQRYRELHRRIDYFPSPDVLAIIDHHQSTGLDHCIAGVIDELIRIGHKTISGNGRTR
jgi:hypothetical protein